MRWYLGQNTANLPAGEDLHHPLRQREPAWVEDNTLGEVNQVADFFKVPHLLSGQL